MSEHDQSQPSVSRPYDGVRVLELAEGISGPYAGRWLAALGADVVKVERTTGDPSRAFGPWPDDLPDDETSGLFLYLNGDKRSVTLNLDTSDGREILRELAASADIVIESFEPGYLVDRGLGYDALSKDNASLVMISITPFGQDRTKRQSSSNGTDPVRRLWSDVADRSPGSAAAEERRIAAVVSGRG